MNKKGIPLFHVPNASLRLSLKIFYYLATNATAAVQLEHIKMELFVPHVLLSVINAQQLYKRILEFFVKSVKLLILCMSKLVWPNVLQVT